MPLTCPHCAAEFTLAEWSQRAGCPSCGRRVTFFEASGRGEGAAGQAGPQGSAGQPASGAGAAARRPRTFMGKPLVWTRAWTIVVLVWVAVAVVLFSARVGMGTLTEFKPEDVIALESVPGALMPDGETTYREAFEEMDRRLGRDGTQQLPVSEQWYILARPWEERTYIVLEVDLHDRGSFLLGWWVEDGEVTPDPATQAFLEAVTAPGSATRELEYPDEPAFLSDVVSRTVAAR